MANYNYNSGYNPMDGYPQLPQPRTNPDAYNNPWFNTQQPPAPNTDPNQYFQPMPQNNEQGIDYGKPVSDPDLYGGGGGGFGGYGGGGGSDTLNRNSNNPWQNLLQPVDNSNGGLGGYGSGRKDPNLDYAFGGSGGNPFGNWPHDDTNPNVYLQYAPQSFQEKLGLAGGWGVDRGGGGVDAAQHQAEVDWVNQNPGSGYSFLPNGHLAYNGTQLDNANGPAYMPYAGMSGFGGGFGSGWTDVADDIGLGPNGALFPAPNGQAGGPARFTDPNMAQQALQYIQSQNPNGQYRIYDAGNGQWGIQAGGAGGNRSVMPVDQTGMGAGNMTGSKLGQGAVDSNGQPIANLGGSANANPDWTKGLPGFSDNIDPSQLFDPTQYGASLGNPQGWMNNVRNAPDWAVAKDPIVGQMQAFLKQQDAGQADAQARLNNPLYGIKDTDYGTPGAIYYDKFLKNVYGTSNAQRGFQELANAFDSNSDAFKRVFGSTQGYGGQGNMFNWNLFPNGKFNDYGSALKQAYSLAVTNPTIDFEPVNIDGVWQIATRANQGEQKSLLAPLPAPAPRSSGGGSGGGYGGGGSSSTYGKTGTGSGVTGAKTAAGLTDEQKKMVQAISGVVNPLIKGGLNSMLPKPPGSADAPVGAKVPVAGGGAGGGNSFWDTIIGAIPGVNPGKLRDVIVPDPNAGGGSDWGDGGTSGGGADWTPDATHDYQNIANGGGNWNTPAQDSRASLPASAPEGSISYDAYGNKMMFTNGQWIPVG